MLTSAMIRRFRHKGLAELWSLGRTARINKTFFERILRRLDRLDVVTEPEGMNLPLCLHHLNK